MNKINEMARGWLPTNNWLNNVQLTANVNINQTCNGFWNGSTINFYRSGGGCRNTGELAGVFDHEWGHGMDDNDANGVISNSGEGYADIAAIYRYQDSCVGHGFFLPPAGSCGLTADGTGRNTDEDQTAGVHCATDCSGRARCRLPQALGPVARHRARPRLHAVQSPAPGPADARCTARPRLSARRRGTSWPATCPRLASIARPRS